MCALHLPKDVSPISTKKALIHDQIPVIAFHATLARSYPFILVFIIFMFKYKSKVSPSSLIWSHFCLLIIFIGVLLVLYGCSQFLCWFPCDLSVLLNFIKRLTKEFYDPEELRIPGEHGLQNQLSRTYRSSQTQVVLMEPTWVCTRSLHICYGCLGFCEITNSESGSVSV